MKELHLISGMVRSGSTLLSNLLAINPGFHVTPTSATNDMLERIIDVFSHNITFKAQDRLELYENHRMGLKGWIEGFFYDKDIVFDKCRAWSNKLPKLDQIFGHQDTKVIWCYRNPVMIVNSIEKSYMETILLKNTDEAEFPDKFLTVEGRIDEYCNGIIGLPVKLLHDAISMGYEERILIVKYENLCANPIKELNKIHDFVGIDKYNYKLKKLTQSTKEFDGMYNYKFKHKIRTDKIENQSDSIIYPNKLITEIDKSFSWLNEFVKQK